MDDVSDEMSDSPSQRKPSILMSWEEMDQWVQRLREQGNDLIGCLVDFTDTGITAKRIPSETSTDER